jgi:hypothetical protein
MTSRITWVPELYGPRGVGRAGKADGAFLR